MFPRRNSARRRAFVLAGAVLPLVLGTPAIASAAATPGGRVTVENSRPAWTNASADRGPTNPSTSLDLRVYLAGRDPQGLAAYAAAVSDPHSAAFHHYLTPARTRSRFGGTAAQTRAVTSWLTRSGLKVDKVTDHYVSVRGSVASAQQAFGVALHDYTVKNATLRGPAGEVTVPAAVAPDVLGVTGLDDGKHQAGPAEDPPGPPTVTIRAAPCSHYYGETKATDQPPAYGHTGVWTQCGDTPQQIRSVYGLDKVAATGSGSTVAVVDAFASPTIAGDVTLYSRIHGTADFKAGQFTQNLPDDYNSVEECGGPIWGLEETLDVEAVHNVAPDAGVTYVGAASCQDTDLADALSRIVDDHLADIVTNSWGTELNGTPPALRAEYDQIFQLGATEGIGFYFITGDCGTWDPATPCGAGNGSTAQQVAFPAESPWVTAVGGTTLAVGGDGREVFQTGWGNVRSAKTSDGTGWTPVPPAGYPANFYQGGGGGTSTDYQQPSYQAGVVPASLSKTLLDGSTTTTPMRVLPDVATEGDNNTGMLVGETQLYKDGTPHYHETRWGGTSLSGPLFAGLQAIAQQAQGGEKIGFANPVLYARHGTSAYEDVTDTPKGAGTLLGVVRNDYTDPSDSSSPVITRLWTFGEDGPLHAVAGFDNVTGLGAPSTRYVQSYAAAARARR
ncbi:S53 family peptidase [Actinoallomurus iriomotensis]|uniref:S53 family peptidase n=1 Tax=Actinoallomurus iriomotensis TaxID=478107 RepID=UPI0025529B23|nr:S53 family peptidase [Actinoallomurus iriomotensis]